MYCVARQATLGLIHAGSRRRTSGILTLGSQRMTSKPRWKKVIVWGSVSRVGFGVRYSYQTNRSIFGVVCSVFVSFILTLLAICIFSPFPSRLLFALLGYRLFFILQSLLVPKSIFAFRVVSRNGYGWMNNRKRVWNKGPNVKKKHGIDISRQWQVW